MVTLALQSRLSRVRRVSLNNLESVTFSMLPLSRLSRPQGLDLVIHDMSWRGKHGSLVLASCNEDVGEYATNVYVARYVAISGSNCLQTSCSIIASGRHVSVSLAFLYKTVSFPSSLSNSFPRCQPSSKSCETFRPRDLHLTLSHKQQVYQLSRKAPDWFLVDLPDQHISASGSYPSNLGNSIWHQRLHFDL
jgi:hypothetical protein